MSNTTAARWSPRWNWLSQWLLAAVALGGVALVAWVWQIGLARFGPDAGWLLVQAPLTICAAALAWRFASNHERRWILPARQLHRLMEEIHAGDAPIDSLSQVTGPIAPLARSVQQLLSELRRQNQRNERLEAEIGQRVRNRTDVLERKITNWQMQAFRDVLTGLGNRRLLDEQLPKLLQQCATEENLLCVLSIDVDHFKNVNDTHGHSVGDRLLRDVGQLIRSAVREGDLAFRLGGDEFLLLLPGSDWPAGKNLARRLVALVDQMAATLKTVPKPGLSVGIICPDNLRQISGADLLRLADAAMYQEKSARKAAG
jgi:diguanylate cyclase (GGDEF)-like protein